MKEEIKAIIFDVGGVLALGKTIFFKNKERNSVHVGIARKLKISLDQWFDAIDSIYGKSIEGQVPKEKVLTTLSEKLNISKRNLTKIVTSEYNSHFKQNKQLFKTAKDLKKKGYKVAVLSDQWYLSQDALMPNSLYSFFDKIIVSCEVGMRKPNPKIYKYTLKKLKLKPQQTVFIDNQMWNLKPAQELGMNTILFKNNKQTIKELGEFLR